MVLTLDTGLYKLTGRKPADASQAPFIIGDNSQSLKYHDLISALTRLAPTLLAYDNSRFCN
jgi:hypothetical protein